MGQTFSTVPPHLVRIHLHTPSQVCCDRSVWLPLTNNASRNSWDPLNPQILFFSNIFYTKKTPERHVTIHSMLVFQKLFCTSNKLFIGTCKMWARATGAAQWQHHSVFQVPLLVNKIILPVDVESVVLPSVGNGTSDMTNKKNGYMLVLRMYLL